MRFAIGVGVAAAVGCALVQDFDHYSEKSLVGDSGVDTSIGEVEPIVEEEVSLPDVAPVEINIDTYEPPTDSGSPCPSGQIRCGDTCRDIANDRDHCGSTCASCEAQGFKGAARCVSGSCQCATGTTKCGDTCTYLDTDPLNCGTCGTKVSDSSQTCSKSTRTCTWKLQSCIEWFFTYDMTRYDVRCPASKCIDTSGEANFCFEYNASGDITWKRRCYGAPLIGWCINNACDYEDASPANNPCVGLPDHIECPVVTSPTDASKRVRSCVDKMHDPNHCGGCNLKCAGPDELCADGACKKYRPAKDPKDCASGWLFCKPAGFTSNVCIYAAACPK